MISIALVRAMGLAMVMPMGMGITTVQAIHTEGKGIQV